MCPEPIDLITPQICIVNIPIFTLSGISNHLNDPLTSLEFECPFLLMCGPLYPQLLFHLFLDLIGCGLDKAPPSSGCAAGGGRVPASVYRPGWRQVAGTAPGNNLGISLLYPSVDIDTSKWC